MISAGTTKSQRQTCHSQGTEIGLQYGLREEDPAKYDPVRYNSVRLQHMLNASSMLRRCFRDTAFPSLADRDTGNDRSGWRRGVALPSSISASMLPNANQHFRRDKVAGSVPITRVGHMVLEICASQSHHVQFCCHLH
jgi:hypothetical protein